MHAHARGRAPSAVRQRNEVMAVAMIANGGTTSATRAQAVEIDFIGPTSGASTAAITPMQARSLTPGGTAAQKQADEGGLAAAALRGAKGEQSRSHGRQGSHGRREQALAAIPRRGASGSAVEVRRS